MRKILCVLVALIFLSGCALTTIRPPKKGGRAERRPASAQKTVVEKVREVFVPRPAPVAVEEKEEIK